MRRRFPRSSQFIAARLSPEGELGLHLSAGVAVLLLAAWMFGAIAHGVVTHAEITVLDVRLANWFHARATPALTDALLLVTHVHGVLGLAALTVLLAAYLYAQRATYWLLALGLAVPGGMMLNVMMKQAFQRVRPAFDEPLLSLTTYSFPSGHASSATLFYGMLVAYVAVNSRSWTMRAVTLLAALATVALVGLSRMALGVHYLSDVLAGVAEACAWLAICITSVSSLRRRRAYSQ